MIFIEQNCGPHIEQKCAVFALSWGRVASWNSRAFSVWLAGGGVKGGTIYGATDQFGAEAVTDKVHVHDLHATILRALGFDHTKLTYRFNGRDFRLTDVAGNVVQPILA